MVETRDNEFYAYFTLTGDFDPAAITALIGLEPTHSWIRGSLNEKTYLERKFSRWSLDSRLDKLDSLEKHIADVLSQLDSKVEEVCELAQTFSQPCMQLVGYFYRDYPGLYFDEKLVADLARFGLSVDFDFYYLYSDAREDS